MRAAPLKVMTVIGTRPEIIRLSRVMPALDRVTDHVVVHTGQNYDPELSEVFFRELGLRTPDYQLEVAGGTPAETIGRTIIEVDKVLEIERPEALLALGDTNSCLSVVAAKRRRIPVFHMEAGNRCFDERVPEEINRRIVDHTADINLPYTSVAREYLLAEGLPADRIIKTGSPLFEVLAHYRAAIECSGAIAQLGLERGRYFLVSCHREENVDAPERLRTFAATLSALAQAYGLPILLSTHPRTRTRIEALGLEFDPLVRLCKPFGFLEYNALQINARAVLSDSGTISEESAMLGFPALNLREAHERPEAMEQAVVIMSGISPEQVLRSLEVELARETRPALPADYAVPDVSQKVVRIILSYTDYVRRTVWREAF
ncbi:MAG TPA: UDP-N-acetylglucosamine 2-epimerase (non-hydrolyzing) [Croceibacterium sp.]|nr:UDP-N-acetylglucosamine 2-epimerase (non-hydrolyzing) [Croceibacterium sp.]